MALDLIIKINSFPKGRNAMTIACGRITLKNVTERLNPKAFDASRCPIFTERKLPLKISD